MVLGSAFAGGQDKDYKKVKRSLSLKKDSASCSAASSEASTSSATALGSVPHDKPGTNPGSHSGLEYTNAGGIDSLVRKPEASKAAASPQQPAAAQGKENEPVSEPGGKPIRTEAEAALQSSKCGENKTPQKSRKQKELDSLAFTAAGTAWKIGDDAGPAAKRQRRSRAVDADEEELARVLEMSKREAGVTRLGAASGASPSPGRRCSSSEPIALAVKASPSAVKASPSVGRRKEKSMGRAYLEDSDDDNGDEGGGAKARRKEAGRKRRVLDESDSEGGEGGGGKGGGGGKRGGIEEEEDEEIEDSEDESSPQPSKTPPGSLPSQPGSRSNRKAPRQVSVDESRGPQAANASVRERKQQKPAGAVQEKKEMKEKKPAAGAKRGRGGEASGKRGKEARKGKKEAEAGAEDDEDEWGGRKGDASSSSESEGVPSPSSSEAEEESDDDFEEDDSEDEGRKGKGKGKAAKKGGKAPRAKTAMPTRRTLEVLTRLQRGGKQLGKQAAQGGMSLQAAAALVALATAQAPAPGTAPQASPVPASAAASTSAAAVSGAPACKAGGASAAPAPQDSSSSSSCNTKASAPPPPSATRSLHLVGGAVSLAGSVASMPPRTGLSKRIGGNGGPLGANKTPSGLGPVKRHVGLSRPKNSLHSMPNVVHG